MAEPQLLLAAGGGVEVDFAPGAIAVQIVLFVALWLLLKPTLFEPMLKLFEEREKRIEGAKVIGRNLDTESAGALAKYEAAMGKARSEANAERDKLRAEGTKAEAEILTSVREATGKKLDEGRARIAQDVAAARAKLKMDAQALAKELAARALGREVH
jgi:F-type H+-transporting ATPase subunit b